MIEHQILVRLNKNKHKFWKGKYCNTCQLCKEKNSQFCIEATPVKVKDKKCVFIFCRDCYLSVNDICSKFIYNKKIYAYDCGFHISEKYNKNTCNTVTIKKTKYIYMFPFVSGRLFIY
jgi:hypothetical protein